MSSASSLAPAAAGDRSGPSPETGRPPISLSLVIPARNAAVTLPRVLAGLGAHPPDWEIVVVDDHSTDGTARVAAAAGARVLCSEGRFSDSAARNTGARATSGALLVFLDSDVVAPRSTIERAVRLLEASDAAGLFAIYDEGRDLPDLVTRFKNFWIRHSTLSARRPYRWINTSLALVRRAAHDRVGGFDERYSREMGGGDLDYGRRISEAAGGILVDQSIAVRHLKSFSLLGLLANDFRRARGWLRASVRRRGFRDVMRCPAHANVDVRFTTGMLVTVPLTLSLPLALVVPPMAGATAALGLLHLGLAAPFFDAARRRKIPGWPFFPLILWIDHLACAAGVTVELLSLRLRRGEADREPYPVPAAPVAFEKPPWTAEKSR